MKDEDKLNYSTQKEEPVIPTPPPPTFPTPAHPFPKFLPKPIALIVIILIATALLSGLVFTVYNLGRSSVLKELNPSNPVPPPADPVVYQPTPDPTAEWKTYEGDGYFFKYPGDYVLKENEYKSTLKYFHLNIYNDPTIVEKDLSKYFKISLSVNTLPKNSDLLTYIKSEEDVTMGGTELKIFKDEDIKPYKTGLIDGYYWFGGIEYMGWHVFFERNNKVYTFYYGDTEAGRFEEPEEKPVIFDQILSTFRFE